MILCNRQRAALRALKKENPGRVHLSFHIYTLDCTMPFQVLKKLFKVIQPTSESREWALLKEWETLHKLARTTAIEPGLMSWETTFQRCIRAGITEISDHRAIKSFLNTVEPLDEAAIKASRVTLSIQPGGIDNSFLKVVGMVRDYLRSNPIAGRTTG